MKKYIKAQWVYGKKKDSVVNIIASLKDVSKNKLCNLENLDHLYLFKKPHDSNWSKINDNDGSILKFLVKFFTKKSIKIQSFYSEKRFFKCFFNEFIKD